MVKPKSIEWTLSATKDFKQILSWYAKRSKHGFFLVKTAIIDNINQASKSPTLFITDPLKKPQNDAVRTFTVYQIRVSYLIYQDKIVVLRLRHTSREPWGY